MKKLDPSFNRMSFAGGSLGFAVFFLAASATAGIHTWDVVEVFSNSDGTIQYVELLDQGTPGSGTEIGVGNGSLSSGLHSFSWTNGAVTPPTGGKRYLIATAAFAALPGGPTPDVIIPVANVPFFSPTGDTIGFAGVDTLVFGAIPTNGLDSFDETAGVALNSPENYAGETGSVDASGTPPVAVPSASKNMLILVCASLLMIGTYALFLRVRRARR